MKPIAIIALCGLMGAPLVIVGCGDDAASPPPVAIVNRIDEIRTDIDHIKFAAILIKEGNEPWNPVYDGLSGSEKKLFGAPAPKPDDASLLSITEGGHYFIFLGRFGSTWKASITRYPDGTGSDFIGVSLEDCLSKIRASFGFVKEFSVIESDCALQ